MRLRLSKTDKCHWDSVAAIGSRPQRTGPRSVSWNLAGWTDGCSRRDGSKRFTGRTMEKAAEQVEAQRLDGRLTTGAASRGETKVWAPRSR